MADVTLNALVRKRAELAGEMERHEATARQLRVDLAGLDATIRLFDPDTDPQRIKPKAFRPERPGSKGQFGYVIFSTLRAAGRPCTASELALHVMAARGLDTAKKRLVRDMLGRTTSALGYYRRRGLLQAMAKPGVGLLWEIAAND